jgi:hypothetical protein
MGFALADGVLQSETEILRVGAVLSRCVNSMPLPFLDEFRQDALRENRIRFLQEGAPRFFERWHWFQYHFSRLPPTRFGQSIIDACIRLETVRTGLG